MIQLNTGDTVEHEVYGEVELTGFSSVADEIEIDEVEKDSEQFLDVVMSVQSDQIEFIDSDGSEHVEPLETFYEHVDI